MTRARIWLPLLLLVAGLLMWSSWPSQAAGGPFETAKVQLYSNGKVVGEWEAVGPGRVEGDTFVFPVRKGVRDVDVRISGTFSFETQP